MTPALEIQRLRVWFGTQAVVDGVDLTVQPGEIVALVGESGAGKTLTALAIGRLLPPAARWTAEAIRCHGRDLHTMPDDAFRTVLGRQLAYVFQDPAACLNPVLTIGEQLSEPLLAHQAVHPTDARARAAAALAAMRLADPAALLGRYPHQLSGGMQQRALLAMATILNPAALIADEPTT
ncbi:MAG: ATP-binding cassette domain-containing protein, partial [Candidatus Omnitrophica bacterium]|nr:ATP-binding cassette domain-containing protein [Candidatus Omnitrophota bacterium]